MELCVLSPDRLAAQESRQSSLTGLLYASGPLSAGALVWRWRWQRQRPVRQLVALAREGDSAPAIALTLFDDPSLDDASGAHWRDLPIELQAAGWAATHEVILELMAAVLGTLPVVMEVQSDPPATSGEGAGFEVADDAGHTVCSGVVSLSDELLEAAVSRRTEGGVRVTRLPVAVSFLLDQFNISERACEALSVGAVIRMGVAVHGSDGVDGQVIVADERWSARIRDRRVLVHARLHSQENAMANEIAVEPSSSNETLGEIPVRLTFEVGRVELPLHEVQTLSEGFAFQLDRSLDEQTVTVRANGAVIASGDLVMIGDSLGVRLTEVRQSRRPTAA